jgi:hypothetical protein
MARYFLYLAPDYQDKIGVYQVRLNEDGPGRRRLVDELGVPDRFLDWAEPGDFYNIDKNERLVIRLGRHFDDEEPHPHG